MARSRRRVRSRISSAALLSTVIVKYSIREPGTTADFYRGKTISVVLIGVGAGGEYDTIARLVARYIGRYIPGHPSLVPQNMTGASGERRLF
jgi:tripartite-type tricarboxylate transporter receptor subunit TctC